MRTPSKDSRTAEWSIHSVSIPHREAARRLEQAIRLLLGSSVDLDDSVPTFRRATYVCSPVRPRLDRSAESRSDD